MYNNNNLTFRNDIINVKQNPKIDNKKLKKRKFIFKFLNFNSCKKLFCFCKKKGDDNKSIKSISEEFEISDINEYI